MTQDNLESSLVVGALHRLSLFLQIIYNIHSNINCLRCCNVIVKASAVLVRYYSLMQKIECTTLPDSFCELDEIFPINSAIPSEPAIAFVLWKTGSSGKYWCEKEETSQQEGQGHPDV